MAWRATAGVGICVILLFKILGAKNAKQVPSQKKTEEVFACGANRKKKTPIPVHA